MNANHEQRDEGLELSAEQRMQSLLCAYVLGEADEAERAEVEAALASSAELRAEKARLESAVPIVAGVLKERAGEALSTQSKNELDAAVARRSRPTFFRQPLVRLAASVAIVAGAYAIFRSKAELPPATQRGLDGLDLAQAKGGAEKSTAEAARAKTWGETKLDGALAKNAAPSPQSAKDPKNEGGAPDAVAVEEAQPVTAAATPLSPERELAFGTGAAGEITGATLDQLDGSAAGLDVMQAVVAGRLSGTVPPETAKKVEEQTFVGLAQAPGEVGIGGSASAVGGKFAGRFAGKSPAAPGGAVSAGGSAGPSSSGPDRLAGIELKALHTLGYAEGGAAAGSPAGRDINEERGAEGESAAGAEDFAADSPFALGRFKDIRRQPTDVDLLQRRYQHIHDHCVMPVGPTRPRDMFFRYWGDNPFELALLDRQSTFSIDVDTASYTLARRYLVEGQLPTKEQIRTEEFVNYFKGDVPPPLEGTFAVATEFAPSLFGDDSNTWMMRVAVRGKEVSKAERQPVALTFVVDVSGSMREGARLELVKHSLRLLVSQMDASDSISLIKFSNDAALILPMTSARQKDLIESAIHPLQPEGSTNTEAGLRMGYEQALAALTPNANNRVVLLTDGVANVGITDPNALVQMVERQRKVGIYLNTVGVGMNNHNDHLLEQLANKGDGLCNYVDDEQEVRRALVDNFTGAFQVIARDVKIQVEFDPAQVERYRLLGYENRAIADADFRNDKVDAGEVGAGHQVVALYEIVRRSVTGDGPLATVRLRWKPPFQAGVPENEQGAAQELAHPVQAGSAAASFPATSAGYRRSVLAAQFAEFLRRSVHARRDSLERLIDEARRLSSEMKDKDFEEFVDMAVRSRDLIQAELARRDWLDECGYLLRHRHYLHGQFDELRRRFPQGFENSKHAAVMEEELRGMEQRLGELRQRVEAARGEADQALVERLQAENVELQRSLLQLLEVARRAGTEGK